MKPAWSDRNLTPTSTELASPPLAWIGAAELGQMVKVLEPPPVGVLVGVAVLVGGTGVLVGVLVTSGVFVGVAVFVGVLVGSAVLVGVGVLVRVGVAVGVFVGPRLATNETSTQ